MTRRSVRASWRKLVVGLVAATSLAAPLAMPVVALATDANDIPVTFYPNNSQLNDQYYVTGGYSYSEGSAGFFRYIGATSAAKIAEGEGVYGSSATKYLDEALSNRSKTTSPFNLDSLKTSIDILEKCNELRVKDGCTPLKVDPTLMAYSQVAAAWASHIQSDASVSANAHAVFNDYGSACSAYGENLAWNYSNVDQAFVQWYDNEKELYEWCLEKGYNAESPTKAQIAEFTNETGTDTNSTGHYLNIVRDEEDDRFVTMGAAYCDGSSSYNTYAQSFGRLEGGTTYTVSEFKQKLNEYLSKVEDTRPPKATQTITCQSSFEKTMKDPGFWLNATALGGARLSYSSSDNSVVSVTSSGYVSIKGPGTATITITAQETKEYASATKQVSVTVEDLHRHGVGFYWSEEPEHGTVEVVGGEFHEVGSIVNIEVTPDEGYVLDYFSALNCITEKVFPLAEDGNVFAFVMPDADVTLEASFVRAQGKVEVGSVSGKGNVSVSPLGSQEPGTTITITLNPDEGYEIGEVKVTDSNGKQLNLSGSDGTRTFVMPENVDVKISVTFTSTEEDDPAIFPDVSADDWYFGPVEWAVETGLMGGKADGTFAPGEKLSRAQLAVVLWNRAGNPSADPSAADAFVDTDPSGFYAGALNWCVENGYFMGLDSAHFSPSTSMTRESLAVVLWRMADYPESSYDLSRFPDGDRVSSYAGTAVRWAVENGIISGQGNGTLDPQGAIDRAQCAAIFQRLASK